MMFIKLETAILNTILICYCVCMMFITLATAVWHDSVATKRHTWDFLSGWPWLCVPSHQQYRG